MRTIAVFEDTIGVAKCKGCGAEITWAVIVKSGKKMCFTGQPAPEETTRLEPSGRFVQHIDFDKNHWATCAMKDQFKRKP